MKASTAVPNAAAFVDTGAVLAGGAAVCAGVFTLGLQPAAMSAVAMKADNVATRTVRMRTAPAVGVWNGRA
jgi:hypothetical protein